MKNKLRIAIEVFAPPLLGTLALFIWRWDDFVEVTGNIVQTFTSYLIFAYAFGLIPSITYAALMELWLRQYHRGILALLITVALSTILGFAAGWTIHHASESSVIEIGIIVGFVLGPILYIIPAAKRPQAIQASEPRL